MQTIEQQLKVCLNIIQSIYNDANMALDGSWDKSDEGFKDQMLNIESKLRQADLPIPEYNTSIKE